MPEKRVLNVRLGQGYMKQLHPPEQQACFLGSRYQQESPRSFLPIGVYFWVPIQFFPLSGGMRLGRPRAARVAFR